MTRRPLFLQLAAAVLGFGALLAVEPSLAAGARPAPAVRAAKTAEKAKPADKSNQRVKASDGKRSEAGAKTAEAAEPDRGAADGQKDPAKASPWYLEKPPSATQVQKEAKVRGVDPCMTPDPGFGVYTRWKSEMPFGQLIIPERGGITKDGGVDVMLHFHGHEPVRKEWVKVMTGPILVGIDLGIGSGPYSRTFSAPSELKRVLDGVLKIASKHHGREVHVRKLGLSAWSAGYGAIFSILQDQEMFQRVDTVVLLDGLHTGYRGNDLNGALLAPFLDFARAAKAGKKLMFVSHSSIIPPDYASTTETANYLIAKLGGHPKKAKRGDLMGLELISRYDVGNFHVRGYTGNDKMDHCAHIGLYRDILRTHVGKRWSSPKGRGAATESGRRGARETAAAPKPARRARDENDGAVAKR